jgi:hypothetical protein
MNSLCERKSYEQLNRENYQFNKYSRNFPIGGGGPIKNNVQIPVSDARMLCQQYYQNCVNTRPQDTGLCKVWLDACNAESYYSVVFKH